MEFSIHFFAWDLAVVRISGCDNKARVDCNKSIGSNVFSTFTVEKKKETEQCERLRLIKDCFGH